MENALIFVSGSQGSTDDFSPHENRLGATNKDGFCPWIRALPGSCFNLGISILPALGTSLPCAFSQTPLSTSTEKLCAPNVFRASCGTIPAASAVSHKNVSRLREHSVCVCHRKKQLQPCKHGAFLPCSEQTALLTPIYPLPSKNPAWFNAFFSPSVNVSLLSVGLERSWRRSQPDPGLSCWGISVVLERQGQLSDTPGLGPWGSTCLTSGGAGGRALQPLGCHSGSQGNKSEKESLLKRGGKI